MNKKEEKVFLEKIEESLKMSPNKIADTTLKYISQIDEEIEENGGSILDNKKLIDLRKSFVDQLKKIGAKPFSIYLEVMVEYREFLKSKYPKFATKSAEYIVQFATEMFNDNSGEDDSD